MFKKDLEILLNTYSEENQSGTPDYILAQYLKDCLDAFNTATTAREYFYAPEARNENRRID